LGTDCPGIESVGAALVELGVDFVHAVASERDKVARKFLRHRWGPRALSKDVTKRKMARTPRCDIYAAGFPCQPFSAQGKGEGIHDSRGRGTIFSSILEYIDVKKPKAFLLENVEGLMQEAHHEDFMKMIQKLEAAAEGRYSVKWDVSNTADFGTPQNRERIYIIGAPKTCKPKFAMPIPPARRRTRT